MKDTSLSEQELE